jgi:hypothetical protein
MTTEPKKTFTKPTLEEVTDYAKEIGFTTFNPQYFMDYYESNGWHVGRVKMKDWKATIRMWKYRDGQRNPVTTVQPALTPRQQALLEMK